MGRLSGTVSEVAQKFVMEMERVDEMGRWRKGTNWVPKREVRERVHDWLLLENERGKSALVLVLVLVLGLRRRVCEEKVGMEAIEERGESFWGVGLDDFVVCTLVLPLVVERDLFRYFETHIEFTFTKIKKPIKPPNLSLSFFVSYFQISSCLY